jgi:hypothetical protein
MLFEPIVLGLLLAPSVIGVLISLIAIFTFLMRPPTKIIISDWQHHRRSVRTAYAQGFVFLYALIVCACGLIITMVAPPSFFAAFMLASHGWLVLSIVFLVLILRLIWNFMHGSRDLVAQILGGVSLNSTSTLIVSTTGWAIGASLILWMILSLRVINSIFYVRARIRLDRGKPVSILPTAAVHLIGVLAVFVLAIMGYVPYLAIFPSVVLLIRMGVGLSPLRRSIQPQAIGIQELGYGILTVILLALAFELEL